MPSKAPGVEAVRTELSRWDKNFIDVSVLRAKSDKAAADMAALKEKLTILERRVQVSATFYLIPLHFGILSWQ